MKQGPVQEAATARLEWSGSETRLPYDVAPSASASTRNDGVQLRVRMQASTATVIRQGASIELRRIAAQPSDEIAICSFTL